ncbi:MAG TPA: hypothetical protein VGN81_05730 [Pseudonocardiaceae bacterium]|jgi:hypothetical protein
MIQPPNNPPSELPKPLRTARVLIWIQFAASVLLLVLVFGEVASIADHGQQMSSLGMFEVVEDPIVVVLALIAAIFIASRKPWVRPLVVIVEALAVMNGIINVVSGAVAGLVGIVLAIFVVTLMFRPEVTAWAEAPAA